MDGSRSPSSRVETVDDVLAHFGIKGMKWGVRRNSATKHPPAAKSIDAIRAEEARKKLGKKNDASALTNQELQHLVTRMNLERQLSTLTSQQPKGAGAAGAKIAQEILLNVGKQQLTKIASDTVTKQIAKAAAKK